MLGPMTLVTLAGVSKSHAAQHLFSDVGLMISAGRRFAIIGPNGAGKTTLLEMITGDQSPDSGTITRARDTVIGYLRQEVAESRGRSGAGGSPGRSRRGQRDRAADAPHRDKSSRTSTTMPSSPS